MGQEVKCSNCGSTKHTACGKSRRLGDLIKERVKEATGDEPIILGFVPKD